MHIFSNVKVVPSIEFQGESESVIAFWFRYLFDVLFVVMCMYTGNIRGRGGLRMKVTCDINVVIA